MKQQMEKVEADLSRSKVLREKQSKEFSWQLEELKQRYEQQDALDLLGCRHCWNCLEEFCHANGGFLKDSGAEAGA
ncbi:centrosomal protein of 112 kDa-like isoform X2 [Meleagris gallopavo]|uniref:centrosomal protein of 112 kDa-like isoform X2 n=1 Tax=Meleagris gallopavo TaxID=9103 RepID=UPI0012ABB631|nr:centrosomal protein of 112 kDa-like isoform X2 [Meleagris gallopavo]